MLRKSLAMFLAVTLFPTAFALQSASAATNAREDRLAEKMRTGIYKLGVGKDARVEVKLRDKAMLTGYVSAAGEDSFVVTDPETGAAITVAYPDVAQVKGNNLSKGAKIAIGVGIAAAVLIAVFLKWVSQFE